MMRCQAFDVSVFEIFHELFLFFILIVPRFPLTYNVGIIHLYLHSNMDRPPSNLLLFSWPSVLLASKIIAAFKYLCCISDRRKAFCLKNFHFMGQLSLYAIWKKTEPWPQLQTRPVLTALEGIRFDSPTLFLFSSSFCGQWFWLCGGLY